MEQTLLSLLAESVQTSEVSSVLEIVALLTLLSLGPALLVTLTSFTRIVVVLSFLRQALGTQQSPSNQIIIALSLFLSNVWQRYLITVKDKGRDTRAVDRSLLSLSSGFRIFRRGLVS